MPMTIAEPIMPLADLIRYFNMQLHRPPHTKEGGYFALAGGQVQAHFKGRVFGTLFQPQVRRGGHIVCHEAFLRELTPAGEGLSTQVLFEQSPEHELIQLDRMAHDLHALNFVLQRDQRNSFLALNFSPESLLALQGDEGKVFDTVLSSCGLKAERVVLEMIDTGFGDCAEVAAAIARYRAKGYQVALDNFGRYSWDLERLKTLAPDIVKLDRCLIGHAGHLSLAKQVLVELTSEIQGLGMVVVSQCIENAQQLQAAMESSADWFQGYFIARPALTCQPSVHLAYSCPESPALPMVIQA